MLSTFSQRILDTLKNKAPSLPPPNGGGDSLPLGEGWGGAKN